MSGKSLEIYEGGGGQKTDNQRTHSLKPRQSKYRHGHCTDRSKDRHGHFTDRSNDRHGHFTDRSNDRHGHFTDSSKDRHGRCTRLYRQVKGPTWSFYRHTKDRKRHNTRAIPVHTHQFPKLARVLCVGIMTMSVL